MVKKQPIKDKVNLVEDLENAGGTVEEKGKRLNVNPGDQFVQVVGGQEGDHLTIGDTTLKLEEYGCQIVNNEDGFFKEDNGQICLTF